MVDPDFEERIRGGRLTTTEILYFMPDHESLLQAFIWQTIDLPPEFPKIHRFLGFWRREIHAVIHSVSVSCSGLILPIQWKRADEIGTRH